MSKNKKILFILISVLVVIFLIFLFFRNSDPNQTGEQITDSEFFPLVGNETVVRPTDTESEDFIGGTREARKNLVKIKDLVSEGLYVSDGILYFVDKQSGNLYSFNPNDKKSKRLTNTTISAVHKSLFGKEEDSLFVINRYLKGDNIQNFSGFLKTGTSTEDISGLVGKIIPGNISEIAVSPNDKFLFLIEKGVDGVTFYTSNLSGESRTAITTSPFSEWLPFWKNDNAVYLQTKPSIGISGFAYKLNLGNKSLEKILGGIAGLSILPETNGDKILYSQSDINNFKTFILNESLVEPVPLSVQIIPEKCVWRSLSSYLYCLVPNEILVGDFPDPWYRGEKSFNDNIWKINSDTGEVFVLFATEIDTNGSANFDGISPVLDEQNSILYFIDKKDSGLWMLDLSGLE